MKKKEEGVPARYGTTGRPHSTKPGNLQPHYSHCGLTLLPLTLWLDNLTNSHCVAWQTAHITAWQPHCSHVGSTLLLMWLDNLTNSHCVAWPTAHIKAWQPDKLTLCGLTNCSHYGLTTSLLSCWLNITSHMAWQPDKLALCDLASLFILWLNITTHIVWINITAHTMAWQPDKLTLCDLTSLLILWLDNLTTHIVWLDITAHTMARQPDNSHNVTWHNCSYYGLTTWQLTLCGSTSLLTFLLL